jgi:hypothetical protein
MNKAVVFKYLDAVNNKSLSTLKIFLFVSLSKFFPENFDSKCDDIVVSLLR